MKLKGEKVVLRKIKVSDAANLHKWLQDPNIGKHFGIESTSKTKEVGWIIYVLRKYNTKKYFGIETLDGTHIGSIGLDIEKDDNKAEFSVYIGDENYRGGGYGKDAILTLLKYGFETLKLNRIELKVIPENTGAIELYKKLGFKKEGVKRQNFLLGGRYYDHILMSILKSEWDKR